MAAKKKLEKRSTDLFNSITERTADNLEDLFGFSSELGDSEKEEIRQGVADAEARGVEMIDIDLLDANELSRYHMRDEESLEALKELIKANGFEKSFAIVGKKKPDGRVTILSGHRRTAVAKSLTDENGLPLITKLPITYKEFDREVKELEFVTAANLKRAENISDILSMYQLFSDHYDRGDWTKEETEGYAGKIDFIAGKMGISANKIKHSLFLLRYDPALWEYIDLGILSVNDLRKLHQDSEKGNITNRDELIKKLVESEQIRKAVDGKEDISAAKKEAKEILAGAARKYERKKKKSESAAIVVSRIKKELVKTGSVTAEGLSEKDRSTALKELEDIRKELDRLESLISEG